MAFPGPKVHRPSRRKLGRGQFPTVPDATATVTAFSADVAAITFNQPMVISGPIAFHVATLTPIGQTIVSPTEVRFSYASPVSSHAWTLEGNQANAATMQGGNVAPASGTFS